MSGSKKGDKKNAWFGSEVLTLRTLYPVASWNTLTASLPRHSPGSIVQMAVKEKLRRPKMRNPSVKGLFQKLREAREAKNLRQCDLSLLLGLHENSIGNWERGRFPPRRFDMLLAWADVLDLSFTVQPKETPDERMSRKTGEIHR